MYDYLIVVIIIEIMKTKLVNFSQEKNDKSGCLTFSIYYMLHIDEPEYFDTDLQNIVVRNKFE